MGMGIITKTTHLLDNCSYDVESYIYMFECYAEIFGEDSKPSFSLDGDTLLGISGIGSWRGSYDELSFHYTSLSNEEDVLSCDQIIKLIGSCIGKTFYGYKGGEYTMHIVTSVWIDNYGCYSGERNFVGFDSGGCLIVDFD